MQMVQLSLNTVIYKNPHLKNALDRSVFNRLVRTFTIIPITN